MFSKLLKHDMKAILKYWWLAAVSSPVLAVMCGVCSNISRSPSVGGTLEIMALLGLYIGVIGLCAFGAITEVLILVRFYKNFFTDEGYLTFTLPVKRSHLLLSKLVSAVLFTVFTAIALVFDGLTVFATADPVEFFRYRWVRDIVNVVKEIYSATGGYLYLYIFEGLLGALVLLVFSILSFFACINLAAVVVKKHKVLAAVGIYYLFSAVMSFLMQFAFNQAGIIMAFEKIALLEPEAYLPLIAVMLFGGIAVLAVLSAALYSFELWLLHRKLNLE